MNEIIQAPTAIGPIPIDVIRVPDSGSTVDLFLGTLLLLAFWFVLRVIVSLER